MWKRDESPDSPEVRSADPAVVNQGSRPRSGSSPASIGRSITVRGEVTGDEDLIIQGRVEGSVDLRQHAVTVGSEGDVKADIIARILVVEGRVQGNLSAEEQVMLRSSARVEGDIRAPRLVLEDGARFRGGVDMGDPEDRPERKSVGRSSEGATGSTPSAGSGSGSAPGSASGSGAPRSVGGTLAPEDTPAPTGSGASSRDKVPSGSNAKS
jgi:cytoskeletal protein CcmA (bactofilin family)